MRLNIKGGGARFFRAFVNSELEGQGGQFGTHLGLLGSSGRYGYFWLYIWAGCGSEPVQRRCPETQPKVRGIHGATFGGPNSELIKALKNLAPLLSAIQRSLCQAPVLTIKYQCFLKILGRLPVTAQWW